MATAESMACSFLTFQSMACSILQEIQALRPRTMFVDRVVRPTVNAMYTRGGQVQRLLPLFVAEMARRDKFAACLAGPSIYDHRYLHVQPQCSCDIHMNAQLPMPQI